MPFKCDNITNESVQYSLDLMESSQAGFWITLFIGIHGLGNNCVLLSLAYRKRWHHSAHYALIIKQAIIDMLSGLIEICVGMYWLSYIFFERSPIMHQSTCVFFFVPVCVLLTYGQKSALAIAVDRLINVWKPYWWVSAGIWYRIGLISFAFTWSLVQETGWLFFLNEDVCVEFCCIYASYPQRAGWSTVVTTGDMVTSGLVCLVYMALPLLSGSMIERLNCGPIFVSLDGMREKQRFLVNSVRTLSFLTVTSFMVTAFLGFLATGLTAVYNIENDRLEYHVQMFGNALASMNTVLPLYLYLWREKTLRVW